jgi:hypothetical protein
MHGPGRITADHGERGGVAGVHRLFFLQTRIVGHNALFTRAGASTSFAFFLRSESSNFSPPAQGRLQVEVKMHRGGPGFEVGTWRVPVAGMERRRQQIPADQGERGVAELHRLFFLQARIVGCDASAMKH